MAYSHQHTPECQQYETIKETANDTAAQGHLHHHANESYDKHAGHHTEDFLKRFWPIVTIPMLIIP
jgi:Cu2+-exporting ATPase